MKSEIASPVKATRNNLLRGMVFATVALASSAAGQVSPAPADAQYPLAIKTRWNYQMREEFGPGVHPNERDAPLLKGNVIETTLVSEVTGYDMIGGARYARVESSVNGRPWLTEWFRFTPEGMFVGKRTEDGEEKLLAPPQKILSPTLATGESWTWKASDNPVTSATRVVGKEVTEVPAGKFDATKLTNELTMAQPEGKVRVSQSLWFSPGVGYVRELTEAYLGDRFVSRTWLTLVGLESGQRAPVSQARSGAPAAPAGTAVRYEARWDLQNSGVTDQLNSVYFIDVDTGWAAGANNTILKTVDGGKTWSRVLEREEGGNKFSSIYFTNAKEGWAQGRILLHSSDGGETWRPASPLPDRKNLGDGGAVGTIRLQTGHVRHQRPPLTGARMAVQPGPTFQSCRATLSDRSSSLDPQHIWLAGDYGLYALTTDGGGSWQEPAMPVKARLEKVYFVSAKIGWILPSES